MFTITKDKHKLHITINARTQNSDIDFPNDFSCYILDKTFVDSCII